MAGDEEQVEALKKWWSESGKSVVAGLAIGLAAVAGWSSWQTWQTSQAELASVRYEQLVNDATGLLNLRHRHHVLQAQVAVLVVELDLLVR